MKKVLILLIISLTVFGCSKTDKIKELMETNEYIIIDVRTSQEYDETHIKGAINIPYDELQNDIELDKNKLIFVYCQSGNRSNIAYKTLTNLGYNVYDMGALNSIKLEKE